MKKIYRISLELEGTVRFNVTPIETVSEDAEAYYYPNRYGFKKKILKENMNRISSEGNCYDVSNPIKLFVYTEECHVPVFKDQIVQRLQQIVYEVEEKAVQNHKVLEEGFSFLSYVQSIPVGSSDPQLNNTWKHEKDISKEVKLYSYKSQERGDKMYAVVRDGIVEKEFSEFQVKKLDDYISQYQVL